MKYLLWFSILLSGCMKTTVDVPCNGTEKMLTIYPGTNRIIKINPDKCMKSIDIGIDHDLPSQSVNLFLKRESGKMSAMKGITGMKQILCGVETNGQIAIEIAPVSIFSAVKISVRIEKSPSGMCNIKSPVSDDFVALKKLIYRQFRY
ncbi:hypothetical protein KKD49_16770 [Myxococcota bacterium]|nr:hypothetical protein [Myxococcota bacterium]